MITIQKAVLHILDGVGGSTAMGSNTLDLSAGAAEFLEKHLEKCRESDKKPGVFYADSDFLCALHTLKEDGDFIAFARFVGDKLLSAISKTEEQKSESLFVLKANVEGREVLALFFTPNLTSFLPEVSRVEEGLFTSISRSGALLPDPARRMEEFAMIDWETEAIEVKSKRYTLDGSAICILPELVLECSLSSSPQAAVKKAQQVAKKVAESYGRNEIETAAAVKSFVADAMEGGALIDPLEVGREVFKENPSMQADFQKEMEKAGITEPVRIEQPAMLKKMKNHKLRTDTGIELVIPTDYFDSTEFIEFVKTEDGSISITLKHIRNIDDRG
ncbi:nucleoid-associated protein [Selenomonas sp. TAMA-11512]|uniref:nucleoid-associated protein n=1 Tax=Selenomonas sp. TAMA-11512 TaxID=3095337 RepID=UPI00308FA1DF|nr:nucleoid-associated protein [Selenomonas sp. TAMA-11512]